MVHVSIWGTIVSSSRISRLDRLRKKFGNCSLSPAEPGLEVQLTKFSDPASHIGIVRSVSKLLSLQNLEYLCIVEIAHLAEDIWVDCFGCLQRTFISCLSSILV